MFLVQLILTTSAFAQTTGTNTGTNTNPAGQVFNNGTMPELNAQNFRPTIDGKRTLWSDDASRGKHNSPFARLLFHYTANPLIYVAAGAGQTNTGTGTGTTTGVTANNPDANGDGELGLVTTVVQGDVLAGYTYDRFRVGVDVPIYLFSDSEVVDGQTGLGDISPDLKITIMDGEDAPFNFAVNGRLNLPTATVAPTIALGNPNIGWEAAGIIDKPIGDALIALNVGYKGAVDLVLEEDGHNDFLAFRTALGYAFSENAGTAIELAGQMDFQDPTAQGSTPIEWLLGGYGYATDDLVLRGGVGTGITVGIGSPDLRLMLGLGYEPRADREPKDSDGDGIVDKEDECPQEPEDVDNFEDTNGCPDPDNDADGILDVADQCPMEPEDKDNYKDDDGCPDGTASVKIRVVDENGKVIDLAKMTLTGPDLKKKAKNSLTVDLPPGKYQVAATAGTYEPNTKGFMVEEESKNVDIMLKQKADTSVVVTRDRIDLKDKVYFDVSKATIKPISYPLLNQAIGILKDYPEIRKLRIEGHTDARGSASSNLKLSKARAASVMEYFIQQGVSASRLTSEGYGEERPLDTASNEAAWSKNRRVDFFIESWVDEP